MLGGGADGARLLERPEAGSTRAEIGQRLHRVELRTPPPATGVRSWGRAMRVGVPDRLEAGKRDEQGLSPTI